MATTNLTVNTHASGSGNLSVDGAGIDNFISNIVAEALFVASESSIMRPLVRNYTVAPNSGKTIQVPIYPTVSAAAIAEGTDLGNTTVATSQKTISIGEKGVMATVSDLAVNTGSDDVVRSLGKLFGEAIAKKMDLDLTALFSALNGGTLIGDATASDGTQVLTVDEIFKAIATLRANSVPMTDLACVLHPNVAYDLKKSMTNTFGSSGNVSDMANEALRSGFVGQLGGVPVFESANIADTGTAGDFVGGLFHKDALGLAMMQDIKIVTERDESLRATEVIATAVYGVGELHDSYGVGISADSSIQ
jgi:N4-gp56 family major capsid protein